MRVWMMLVLGMVLHAAAGAQSLVTNDEFLSEQAAMAKSGPRAVAKALPVPGAPRIEVLAPDNRSGGLVAPFEIRLKFVPEDGAQIVPDSIKVLYGMLGLDITSRVMKLAEFKNNILHIDKANVPAGRHRLTLKVRDSQQREGQAELAVVVQDKPE